MWCSPSMTVGELRARVGRLLGRTDMSASNLRLASSDDLAKLNDVSRSLGSYVGHRGDALPGSCVPVDIVVTERITGAEYDYDSDEASVWRLDPGHYSGSTDSSFFSGTQPWHNH